MMGTTRRGQRGIFTKLLAAILMVFGAGASSVPTLAASAFDNEYKTTSTISLSNAASGSMGACSSVDYSLNWPILFDQASNTNSSQQTTIHSLKTSFEVAKQSGRWGVSGFSDASYSGITIYWTEDTSLSLNWSAPNIPTGVVRAGGNDIKTISFVTQAAWLGNSNCAPWARFALDSFSPDVSYENGYMKNYFIYTDHPNYPVGYGGTFVEDVSVDTDDDGLNKAQEITQGTSDINIGGDTDGDGISDLDESVWYPYRDETFCGTSICAYPHPTNKDLYVEVDWMKDPVSNESYQPTSTQLSAVEDAFSNHGIYIHFDTGQYGGGNELPVYVSDLKLAPDTNDTDFYNLKNGDGDGIDEPNFSYYRRDIWHYMVASNKTSIYDEGSNAFVNTGTGASYAGDDDTLIGVGRVKELAPTNQDQAISGTIMHELGHNLCLSDTAYAGQDSSCLFSGVDHYVGNNYPSVMNYDKQLNMADYSEGLNGMDDHDDWSAISIGMDDFVSSSDPTESFMRSQSAFNKQIEL